MGALIELRVIIMKEWGSMNEPVLYTNIMNIHVLYVYASVVTNYVLIA